LTRTRGRSAYPGKEKEEKGGHRYVSFMRRKGGERVFCESWEGKKKVKLMEKGTGAV